MYVPLFCATLYTDDICCATQSRMFTELEHTLTTDMTALSDYCTRWRLKPSVSKTVSSVFHLHYVYASTQLNVLLDGKCIQHESQPVYLGVMLDHSLTFHANMIKTAAKVRTRNNLITKLDGSTWGASARTLQTATLALSFLVAEYCAPVWCHSSHTKFIDTQLNSATRATSGSIKSTPVSWLSVLSNIEPVSICWKSASGKIVEKIR